MREEAKSMLRDEISSPDPVVQLQTPGPVRPQRQRQSGAQIGGDRF